MIRRRRPPHPRDVGIYLSTGRNYIVTEGYWGPPVTPWPSWQSIMLAAQVDSRDDFDGLIGAARETLSSPATSEPSPPLLPGTPTGCAPEIISFPREYSQGRAASMLVIRKLCTSPESPLSCSLRCLRSHVSGLRMPELPEAGVHIYEASSSFLRAHPLSKPAGNARRLRSEDPDAAGDCRDFVSFMKSGRRPSLASLRGQWGGQPCDAIEKGWAEDRWDRCLARDLVAELTLMVPVAPSPKAGQVFR
jgi:hypothetical protein